MSAEKPTRGIFFDDDIMNIRTVTTMCDKIKGVQIPGQAHTPLIPIDSFKDSFGDGVGPYIDLLKRMNNNDDTYDSTSGIQASHIAELTTWLESIPAEDYPKTVAIFDWDRTLSVFEGIFRYDGIIANIQYYGLDEDTINESMITYLLGGRERLTMIRDMLNMLSEKGVQLFVLTNNGSCSVADNFKQYVTLLTDKIPIANILCSRPPPSSGNKGRYLSRDDYFSLLKTTTGGRRRHRKTRRSYKKRRTLKGKKYGRKL
jgi:hypothetical protein